MAKKKRKPSLAVINGEPHKLMVALINSKWPDGTPKDMTLMLESSIAKISGGEEFTTLYMPSGMVRGDGSELNIKYKTLGQKPDPLKPSQN